MKHLTITYNDQTLYDGEIAELIWSDTESGVKVEGRVRPVRGAAGGPGLLDMLTSLSKSKTAEKQADFAAELEAERAEREPALAESD